MKALFLMVKSAPNSIPMRHKGDSVEQTDWDARFSMDFSLCLTEMQIIIAVASNSGRRLVREYNIERKKVWIEAL
jgi:hypothetical protein